MTEFITVNKIDYPILFGWNAIRKFSEQSGLNIKSLETAIETGMNYTFLAIYIGIEEGCRIEKKPFKLSIDDFVDMFDQDPNAIKDAIKKLMQSMQMIMAKIDSDEKTDELKNVKSQN
jgi:hypothetical protein